MVERLSQQLWSLDGLGLKLKPKFQHLTTLESRASQLTLNSSFLIHNVELK